MKKVASLFATISRSTIIGVIVGLSALGASAALAAYVGPPGAPTTCPSGYPGCDAPLNISGTPQHKPGPLVLGSIAANYSPVGGNWNYTLRLDASNMTSIGFHDSGANIGSIRFENNVFTIGENDGWGAASIYTGAHINATDVYLRNAGKWASQLSNPDPNRFGGMYSRTSGSCYVRNPLTSGCSCPSYAPNSSQILSDMVADANGFSREMTLYYCYRP